MVVKLLTLLRANSIPNSQGEHFEIKNGIPYGENLLEVSSARSAISILLAGLVSPGKNGVALPAYTAEGLVQAVEWAGLAPVFYEQTLDLMVSIKNLRHVFKENRHVTICIVVHPFGILQELETIKTVCSDYSVSLIEDFAQCPMLQDRESKDERGVATIYSFNKWLPVSDGAIVTADPSRFVLTEKLPEPTLLRISGNKSFDRHLKYNRCLNSTDNINEARELLNYSSQEYEQYYELLQSQSEACLPENNLTKIQARYDISRVIQQRRKNALFLWDTMNVSLVRLVYRREQLEKGYPVALPILFRDRSERDYFVRKLFSFGIIAHVQSDKWQFFNLSNQLHHGEKEFVNRHLLLPVNENYSLDEMSHITNAIMNIASEIN